MIRYNDENAEKLFILGDFPAYDSHLYDYAISEILNEFAENVVAVRGNCDGFEIDELMNVELQDVANVEINGRKITMTHGHLFDKNRLPENCGEIFFQGHSHFAEILKMDDKIIANPGSISRPRNGAEPSYIMFDEEKIQIKNLCGEILQEMKI